MARRWSVEENRICYDILEDYRQAIVDKNKKTTVDITWNYAHKLHQLHPIFQDRTVNAVFEHLAYLDDLTAGVGERETYALKDRDSYETRVRADGSPEPNKTKRRQYRKK